MELANHNSKRSNLHEIYSSFPDGQIRDMVFSAWRMWKLPGLMDTSPEALALPVTFLQMLPEILEKLLLKFASKCHARAEKCAESLAKATLM